MGKFMDKVGLPGLGSVVDTGLSIGLGALEQHWSRKNYERQLADQERLIDEERAYNDFGSVISRASAAGVNPLHALGVGAVSGGNTTTDVPNISSPNANPLNVGGFLDAQMKIEQIKAAKIENAFRADRLDLENKYAAAKIKTEESLQTLNSQEVKNKEALEAYTQAQTRYQELLSEYQSQATPQLLDNLRAEYDKMFAETTKMDNENATFKQQFAANMRYVLAQTYQAVYQAKYYRSASEWAGYRSQTERMNATTAEKNVARQEVADKVIADFNKAYAEYLKDTKNIRKWEALNQSFKFAGDFLMSAFSMARQPNQLPSLDVPGAPSIPYGTPNPFDTPYQ